ncbi:MAG TPA: phosphoribosyltransferase family protein [Candidatus Saccharimonadales bacterium]|nr:phosphoribosyltransferase family protein [Candidatus Saccharimonadales bacterium]
MAGVTVASHYDGAIKELIGALKYQRAASAAGLAAELLAPLLASHAIDVVTCVATSPSRYRQRGYNQARLIAQPLARRLGLPYADLLVRTRDVRQVGTSRRQRLEQVQGIFEPRRARLIEGTSILLVDDVVTTGATMAECARVLKEAGAKRVWGAAVAKH